VNIASFLTNFGDLAVTLPIAAVVLLWLLRSRASRPLAAVWMLAVVFCGGATAVLKVYFSACSTSLINSPSGHVAMSTLVYGGLALIAAIRWRRAAVPAVLAGVGIVGAIAATRVLLGAHDLSEVMVGLVIGGLALAMFAKAFIRDLPAIPAKPILATVVLIIVLLHGQQVQAEQLIRAIGGYLHAQHAMACL